MGNLGSRENGWNPHTSVLDLYFFALGPLPCLAPDHRVANLWQSGFLHRWTNWRQCQEPGGWEEPGGGRSLVVGGGESRVFLPLCLRWDLHLHLPPDRPTVALASAWGLQSLLGTRNTTPCLCPSNPRGDGSPPAGANLGAAPPLRAFSHKSSGTPGAILRISSLSVVTVCPGQILTDTLPLLKTHRSANSFNLEGSNPLSLSTAHSTRGKVGATIY